MACCDDCDEGRPCADRDREPHIPHDVVAPQGAEALLQARAYQMGYARAQRELKHVAAATREAHMRITGLHARQALTAACVVLLGIVILRRLSDLELAVFT